ncbi:MAG: hypothetical protein WA857_11120 [Candidatus Acidiferrum sp.]
MRAGKIQNTTLAKPKSKRGVVAGEAVPDLGNPDGVFVGGVFGHDITQTAWHGGGTFLEDRDHFVALAGEQCEFRDESIHGTSLRRIRQNGEESDGGDRFKKFLAVDLHEIMIHAAMAEGRSDW